MSTNGRDGYDFDLDPMFDPVTNRYMAEDREPTDEEMILRTTPAQARAILLRIYCLQRWDTTENVKRIITDGIWS